MIDTNGSAGDFSGRVIVVTGANSGIGLAAAREFARSGARVGLVGRDPGRLESALSAVREVAHPDAPPEAFRADFCVLDDVRKLADSLATTYPSIDVLCNNAGGMLPSRRSTVDGYEETIQANHLAPFLLTNLLRTKLRGGRVVNTASEAHRYGNLDADDLNSSGRYLGMSVYGASKQANILFAAEAARRWPGILSFSYHPGIVRSRFGRDSRFIKTGYRIAPFLSTPEQGADTMVFLAGAPASTVENGSYYAGRKLRRPRARAMDPALAARLWEVSAAALGLAEEASPEEKPVA
ncbi:SDR family NAD(P)-dependent oxidoreductase [Rugosimonospora africana]|uniref:Retinol dehydrogenase n=1 Tax=Rugosimonospora africana TaxID=556532 RepID=A0A8J3QK97_9ACTN|nr:SDR family NAD(P)-dependent oxidoreductase [Rugosimonospora africana]GIH12524.1 retinol dehydrogenase [Rugosimonospora africana]